MIFFFFNLSIRVLESSSRVITRGQLPEASYPRPAIYLFWCREVEGQMTTLNKMTCCRCNRTGRCLNCCCVKNNRSCTNCLPLHLGSCCNEGHVVGALTQTCVSPAILLSLLPQQRPLPPCNQPFNRLLTLLLLHQSSLPPIVLKH